MRVWLVGLSGCIILLTSAWLAQTAVPAETPTLNSSTLKVDPLKLDFGQLPVGQLSAPQSTVLTNTGKAPLRIVDITASGIDFDESNHCGDAIAAGASCEIQMTFRPATSGVRLGVLSVMIANRGTPYYIALTGIGQ